MKGIFSQVGGGFGKSQVIMLYSETLISQVWDNMGDTSQDLKGKDTSRRKEERDKKQPGARDYRVLF